jgi:hypothetical protein
MSETHDPPPEPPGTRASSSLVGAGIRDLPQIGTVFAGYAIDAVLGRGGMSVVYRADNLRLGNKIAIKVLTPELSNDDAFRERFVRESQVAARLNHPNIIPVYDAGDEDGLLYIVMRHIDGFDLKALVRRDGPFEFSRAVNLFEQVGSALQTAHEHDLIHRDVKPANILVERTGAGITAREHAYLGDFGLTKHTLSRSGLTKTGSFLGTVDYVSPEQIAARPADGRSDIYSLGCVLYECVTGVVPFRRDVDYAVLHAHLNDDPTSATSLRFDLPAEIDEILTRSMAKSPDDRYQTVAEMLGDLHHLNERIARRGPSAAQGEAASAHPAVSGGTGTTPDVVSGVSGEPPFQGPPGGDPSYVMPTGPPQRPPTGPPQPPRAEPPQGAPAEPPPPMPTGPPKPPPAADDSGGVGGMPRRARRSVLVVLGIIVVLTAAILIAIFSSRGGSGTPAAAPEGSTGSTTTGTSGSPKGLELVIPNALWSGCNLAPTRANALQTVKCTRGEVNFEVSQYANTKQVQDALASFLSSRGVSAASSSCAPEWLHPVIVTGVPQSLGGHRACFQDAQGDSWIVWTHEAKNKPTKGPQPDHRDVLVIASQHSLLPNRLDLFFALWSGTNKNVAGAIGKVRGT